MYPLRFEYEFFLKKFEESKYECIFLTLGFILLQLLVQLISNQSGRKLGFTFYWFLINGFWIHLYLDGVIGLLDRISPLNYLYFLLDQRYILKEPTVIIITTIEMIFMGPVCLLVAILCKTNQNTFKNILAIIVSTVQITGACFFVHNEFNREWKDVCPFGCFTFTPENIIFFWIFFVAANPVWILVPLWEITKAIKELHSQDQVTTKSTNKKKQ